MKSQLRHTTVVSMLLITGAYSAVASAEPERGFNLTAGAYFDVDEPFFGVAYQIPTGPRFAVVPSAEYVFVDPGDMYTLNIDGRYQLNPVAANPMWIGAGIGMIHRSRFGSSTDPALNLTWGMDFTSMADAFTPFVNTKAAFSDNSEVALSIGVRFGGPRATAKTASNTTNDTTRNSN